MCRPSDFPPYDDVIVISLNKEPAMTYDMPDLDRLTDGDETGYTYRDPRTLLVDEADIPLAKGDYVVDFRGEKWVLTDWESPHKPESTGRVYVTSFPRTPSGEPWTGSYYPSVIGAKFVDPTTNYHMIVQTAQKGATK